MPTRGGRSVLFVDDTKTMRDMANAMLTKNGFDVHLAEDGAAALELLDGGLIPTAILLDVNMPGLNGYDVCRVIRERFKTLRSPVIFVTTNRTPDDIRQARSVGGDYYIVKPFTEESLVTGMKRGFAARQKVLSQ